MTEQSDRLEVLERLADVSRRQDGEQRLIFDSIPAFIWLKDDHNRILRINRPAAAAMGKTPAEMEGRLTREFYPDEAERYYADDCEVITTARPKLGIVEPVRLRTGEARWVRTDKVPYRDDGGRVVGVLVFSVDITESKLLEEQLRKREEDLRRAKDKVEQAYRELEEFAYVTSHDLREPLRMISSYVKLLEKRYKDKLDRDACTFIDFAADGARRMGTLIEALLAYSRVGTRGGELVPTEACEIFDVVARKLASTLQEATAKVSVGDLPRVMADPAQLGQLFELLVENALKFRGERAPQVRIAAREERAHWIFAVSDNGIGIETQYLKQIFGVFRTLHPRDQYPGSGIGLAIASRIVQRHGGRIWAESTPGKGSTFYFTLPRVG